jgi:hypothetical protein
MSRKCANASVGYTCCQFMGSAHSALSSIEALNDTIEDISAGHFWAAELFLGSM